MKKKKLWIFFGIVLVVVVALDFYSPQVTSHLYFWWQKIPGFDAIYGLVGCLVLMLFAKKVLYPLFSRREDYYDR